jgi:lambda family phage tail tape measure protein
MAEPIGALRAELSAGHAQFASDMKKAKNAVQKNASGMSAAMGKVGKKFGEAATALNKYAGYAVAGAIVAATAFIKKQITVADQMGKLAQATGTTSEYLSSMSLVASQGGTTLEAVAKGTERLSRNMYDVSKGIGEAKRVFEDLNIQVTDNEGVLRKSEDVFKDIANKFKGMEDGAAKTAYAMQIFGRAGAELIPMLNGGRAGIEGLQKKAEEMGLVISTETALQAAYFNDQLDLMIKSAQGAGRSLALQIIPWLNETMAVLKYTKEESGGLMAAWVALGAVGDAIFSKSLTQNINETKKQIKELEKKKVNLKINLEDTTRGLSEKHKEPFEKNYLERVKFYQDEIDKVKIKLAELEAQKQKEDDADKSRMEDAMKRAQAEAEQRRKNTEDLIKQSEARLEAETKAAETKANEKAAIKAAEDAEKAIDDQIEALKKQRDMFEMTTAEATLYELALKEGTTIANYLDAKAILEDIDALEKQKTLREEGRALTESMMSAQEKYNETLKNYNELLKAGEIDQQTYDRAAQQALEGLKDTGINVFEELGKQIEGWGRDSARAITDFALEGKGSFSDMVKSMISEMMQLIIYQRIMSPLFSAIGGWVGGLGAGAAAASGAAGLGGASQLSMVASAHGNVFSRGELIPFAKGGIVTRPTIFPMAQGAGLMGEAGAEAIMPLTRIGGDLGVKATGGGGAVVNIYNNVGANVTTKERKTAGGIELDVMIDAAVAKKLGQHGSMSNRAIKQNFGARTQLTGR